MIDKVKIEYFWVAAILIIVLAATTAAQQTINQAGNFGVFQ